MASVRVCDGARAANLNVLVERYRAAPTDPQCRSEEMMADAVSKASSSWSAISRRTDGTVVVTRADDYP